VATPLEFYKASTTTPQNFTGAYSTYLTCNVDRSGKAGTKNFFVIAHVSTTVDALWTKGKARLRQDGSTDLGEVADGFLQHPTPEGYVYNFLKRVSLDNSSHSFTIDLGRVSGTDNFTGENASIVVLEESANAEYAEYETEAGTGADTGWVTYLSHNFSASAENYLILMSCETKNEDESDLGVGGIQFYSDSIPGSFQEENHGELVDTSNDNIYRTVGGACFLSLSGSTTLKINMMGDGVNDEVYCRKGYIIAIPFSDFENVYTDGDGAKSFHTGTSFSDTNVQLLTQACNAADHLIIAACESANESASYAGYWRLRSAGTDFIQHKFQDRDEDNAEWYVSFGVHGVELSSGDYDFEVEGNSTNEGLNYEGCLHHNYLIVCEIPTGEAPPPSYIPQLMMIT